MQRHTQAQNKGWRKIYQANEKRKQTGLAVKVADKTDFNKGKQRQRRILHNATGFNSRYILNIYAPNTGGPRFIKQVLRELQRDLDFYIIILGDF